MSQARFRLLITDDVGNILATPMGDTIDLEGAGTGTCLVYGLSFTGNFTATAGMNVHSSTMLGDDCFALSSNYVAFVREACTVDGGTVTDTAGNDVVWTCPGDGMADFIYLANDGSGTGNYQYLVTDANDTLLALPPANMVELEGAGAGNCKVYGLSYTGNLTVAPGEHIPSVSSFSDGLFDLSDNFLLTVRDQPDTAMINIVGGGTSTTICAGDGSSDLLFIENNSSSQARFRYLITDASGNILATPESNEVDLEGAGPGLCLVYGLSFTGNFTATPGMNVHASSMLSDDCFALSYNHVAVNRLDCSPSCAAPVNLDATPVGSNQVVASWDPVPGALAYQLQAKVNGDFRKNDYFLGTTATYDVKPGRTYEYRVRAICLDDPSDFSSAFTYVHSATREASPATADLQANPSLFTTQLQVQLPAAATTTSVGNASDASASGEGFLQVIDLTGRVRYAQQQQAGSTLTLSTVDWPAGSYRVVWQSDAELRTLPVQKH